MPKTLKQYRSAIRTVGEKEPTARQQRDRTASEHAVSWTATGLTEKKLIAVGRIVVGSLILFSASVATAAVWMDRVGADEHPPVEGSDAPHGNTPVVALEETDCSQAPASQSETPHAAGSVFAPPLKGILLATGDGPLSRFADAVPAGGVHVVNAESAAAPALDIRNRGGVHAGHHRPGIVLHHYTDAPAMQIDNVGHNAGLIIKQARNPNTRLDLSENYVGDGAYLLFTRAGDGSQDPINGRPRIVLSFSKDGDLIMSNNGRKRARRVLADGQDLEVGSPGGALKLRADSHVTITAPIVLPKIDTARNRSLSTAVTALAVDEKTGEPILWHEGRWKTLKLSDGP